MATPEIDREQQIHEEFLEAWLDAAFAALDAEHDPPWNDAHADNPGQ
jgi:hypothetical protein